MWKLLLAYAGLVGLCGVVACAPGAESEDDLDFESSIIAGPGTIVVDEAHPEVGLLRRWENGYLNFCTGTLIGRRTVLTVGHCAKYQTLDFRTTVTDQAALDRLGEAQVTFYLPSATKIRVEQIWSLGHSNDDDPEHKDIALWRLAEPAPTSLYRRIAELAALPIIEGTEMEAYGYGCTQTGAELDGHKRLRRYREGDEKRFICSGDSGGPHFVKNGGQLAYLSHGWRGDRNLVVSVRQYAKLVYDKLAAFEAVGAADPQPLANNLCEQDPSIYGWRCATAMGHSGGNTHLIRCDGGKVADYVGSPEFFRCDRGCVKSDDPQQFNDSCGSTVGSLCNDDAAATWTTWNCSDAHGKAGGDQYRVKCRYGTAIGYQQCAKGCAAQAPVFDPELQRTVYRDDVCQE